MDLILDLLQGAGIAAAIGIRPFLPLLLVGALASADLGVDFDGTDFSFLESPGFLAGVVVATIAVVLYERRRGQGALSSGRFFVPAIVFVAVLGAVEAAGSVADRSDDWWSGLIVGVACAVLGIVASEALFARVRRRLDAEALGGLAVYAEGVALAAAGLSVLFPPLGLVVVAALVVLLVRGRRREGEKYEGLRILR